MTMRIAAVLVTILGVAACAGGPGTIGSGPLQPTAAPLAPALPAAVGEWPGPERVALASFYAAREHRPLWFDDGEHAADRAAVVDHLRSAEVPGVDPDWAAAEVDLDARLAAEVGLTAAVARSTRSGRDVDALVVALADDVLTFQAAPPRASVYGAQDVGIARYRAIAAAGGWPSLPDGPTLDPGVVDPRVDALRQRLLASGDLVPGVSSGPRYDPALVAAVQRFQARHGLGVDGRIGPATRRAMNVSVRDRVRQLERAEAEKRALERQLGERYVLVNVPAYELRYVEGGAVRHAADVVVGAVEFQTPVFSHSIDHLVFNPDWTVPASIANRSLLPQFRANPARMDAEGYRLRNRDGEWLRPTEIEWAELPSAALPYLVRQQPGRANALGDVKFMFPNEHAIYLHDTPTKSYFNRSMRALSNGCVRVQDPMTLATLLLATDGWTRERLDGVVASERTRTIRLSRPVPVHLAYVTAWTEPDGTVQFRDDVYGREAPLTQVAMR